MLSLADAAECTNCPVGNYCPWGSDGTPSISPIECPQGTYNPSNHSVDQLNCILCDPGKSCSSTGLENPDGDCATGHYCPRGTVAPDTYPCQPGTYTMETNLTRSEECSPCPAGSYCTIGTTTPGDCWAGYYCPQFTPTPTRYACPPGTYSNQSKNEKLTDCDQCVPGFYCLGGESDVTGFCPPGYYCLLGTAASDQYPCPNTTYNNVYGQDEQSDCKQCTQGHYCEKGTVNPVECPLGTYMPYGAESSSSPTVVGTPAGRESDCLTCPGGSLCMNGVVTTTGCKVGFYSKPGNSECETCLAGYYCDNDTTSYTDMINNKKCPAGYYCREGLTSETLKEPCTKSYYCPEATPEEIPCPTGTYNPDSTKGSITNCLACTAGFFCLEGSWEPTGDCDKGYYCPTNITNVYPDTSTELPLIGSYGPNQIACPGGTYRNQTNGKVVEDCETCPMGFYCPSGSVDPTECPQGSFCIDGLTVPTPCPKGTYGNNSGLTAEDECTQCDPGYYCDGEGMIVPRGQCDAGYLCWSGAIKSNPNDNITGVECPRGGYCPQGSFEQRACPPGTYSNTSKQTTAKDCTECDPGYFCSEASSPEPDGPCDPGYFCLAGSNRSNEYECSNGTFCRAGSTQETECDIGTYQPERAKGYCLPCPPGRTCPYTGMDDSLPCPAGSYCPTPNEFGNFTSNSTNEGYIGTYNTDGRLCDPGYYNNGTGGVNISACVPCPLGQYCSGYGSTQPTGKCSAGYICYNASYLSEPSQDAASGTTVDVSIGERCHAGKYCLEGATEMLDCPTGTFASNVGSESEAQCSNCTAGKYCNSSGLTAETGDCDPGYYCAGRAFSPQPKDLESEGGDLCPIGSFCNCSSGCSAGTACPTGTYTNRTGMTECFNCDEGYFCEIDKEPIACPVGRYCIGSQGNALDPEKRTLETSPKLCPRGSFSNATGLTEPQSCQQCTAGYYCSQVGLTEPSGKVRAGFYSSGAAARENPSGPCDAEGTFDSAYDCGQCPAGSFCVEGSILPEDCPRGTFSNEVERTAVGDCQNCTAGYFCNGTGMTGVAGPCMEGYYCTGGSQVANPDNSSGWGGKCPVGSFCPLQSIEPQPCPAGKYTGTTGKASCDICPMGYYCELNTSVPLECPEGHYCVNGTESMYQYRCPAGTYNGETMGQSDLDCRPCPAGQYCDRGSSRPTGNCTGGYYCSSAASTPTPINETQGGGQCQSGQYCPEGTSVPLACTPGWYCATPTLTQPTAKCDPGFYCANESSRARPGGDSTGGQCPEGKYCPEGSSTGEDCPSGTFVDTLGSKNVSDCEPCTAGKFCNGSGLISPSGDCAAGYYCPGGQSTDMPTEYICEKGYRCPTGSSQQLACGNGTYQDETRQADCKICPAGFYCDASPGPVVSYNDTVCRKGYYCPDGTAFYHQFPCSPGTYNNNTGSKSDAECNECLGGYYCNEYNLEEPVNLCSAGYFCKRGAVYAAPNETDTTGLCPLGFYCPEGTINPEPCPPGSYSSIGGLEFRDQCMGCPIGEFCDSYNMTTTSGECDAGFYCPANSSSRQEEECPMGKYCLQGTDNPSDCPIGKYSNQSGLASESECLNCPAGKYCDTPGITEPSGDCFGGYYCPEGGTTATPNGTYCQGNFHCPNGTANAKPCEDGYFVDWDYATYCPPCPEGSMCTTARGIENCTAGYYCPAGTGDDKKACPPGTYNPNTRQVNISQCLPCPGGKYCQNAGASDWTGVCDLGYFCVSGMDRRDPDGENSTTISDWCYDGVQAGYGGRCPAGSYCEADSTYPILCPPGNYSSSDGASFCDPCPEGFYCEEGTSNVSLFPCPAGHFCPVGTDARNKYPCPAGTYNSATNKVKEADCPKCKGGMYCPSPGTIEPNMTCPAGYFCPEGSTSGTANICQTGYFCPEGSINQTICLPGYYCDVPQLANVTDECRAGYYCLSGSSFANGSDSGGDCPKGKYCPQGSGAPQDCPRGTYLNQTNGKSELDCQNCDPRYFCEEVGADEPTDFCDAGYYCDGNSRNITSATPASFKCPVGHYCERGSLEPTRCNSGFYQDEEAQSSCKECLQGYYCDNTIAPVVIYNASSICPEGHYCPNGTKTSKEFSCDPGTFRNTTGGISPDSCSLCTGGMFCEIAGLFEPTGECDAGFFCKVGADSSAPALFEDKRGPCPAGHYCLKGTTSPYPCSIGTYNPETGSTNASACLPCTEGNYCPFENMTTDGYPCNEGYYCPSGSGNATQQLCSAGYYCEVGVYREEACPPGTWSDKTGLTSRSNCTLCSAGYYCPRSAQTSVTDECQGGYFCLEGQSSSFDNICPYGVHCPNGSAEYQKCIDGTYTSTEGRSSCEECPAGFYCTPVEANNTSNIQSCPPGYFCPNGTGLNWQSCPAGTYSNSSGLADALECLSCDAGSYCDGTVRTQPNGECDDGYFCTTGVNMRRPSNGTSTGDNCTCSSSENTGWGGICPVGFYCRKGVTTPTPCENGTYANEQGLSACKNCPAGFFCPEQSITYIDKPCPAGYWCPNNTEIGTKFPCMEGTFNPAEGSQVADACVPCLPGQYCSSTAMSSTDGNCTEGYYCILGSSTPDPTDPSVGGECQPGYYCLSGSSSPFSCPVGHFCSVSKLSSPEGLCSAGFYCIQNSTTPSPDGSDATGYPCPPGHFCVNGTESPARCPIGTYSNATQLERESDCSNCSSGMFCNTSGLLSPVGPCSPGYYCPGGDIQSDPPSTACPEGYACTEGSDRPDPCPSGYYQDQQAQPNCKLCPSGCVCNATFGPVVRPCAVVCPEGHFCPNGTMYEEEYPCPKGTYYNGTGLADASGCLSCPATFACDSTGITYPTTKCNAGYYCRSSADSTTPNLSSELANQCPPGFYCPVGTAEPIGCPIGTFSIAYGLMNKSQCTLCTAGFYCDSTNLTSVSGGCDPGFYCPIGSIHSKQEICTAGSYCTANSPAPTPCPVSTYSNTEGLSFEDQCQSCMEGFYCENPGQTNYSGPCQEGFYCPNGSSLATEVPCPIGMYCPAQSSEPRACEDGYYAPSSISSMCILCPAGSFCLSSNISPGNSSSLLQPCPRGYFCPNGTGYDQQPCPAGTFSPDQGLQTVEECQACTAGKYCEGTAKTDVTNDCSSGFYCESGVWTSQPINVDGACNITLGSPHPSIGNICPPGTFCLTGSSNPEPCEAGTYINQSGSSFCLPCPDGYYCPRNTADYFPNICPLGHVCPQGTNFSTETPCPSGTYNNLTTQSGLANCLPCPRGRYCPGTGNIDPEPNECRQGWYCTGGAKSAEDGPQCEIGYYCPQGTRDHIICPAGSYCENPTSWDISGPCTEGYYCPNGSSSPMQENCPRGFYCERGTQSPEPCPTGTYRSQPNGDSLASCDPCPAGSYCDSVGRYDVSGSCDAGYYCPGGDTSPSNGSQECPSGYRCPSGDPASPIPCNSGFFQNLTKQSTCQSCPVGYYCPTAPALPVTSPIICPAGSYCPLETSAENQYLCPAGKFNNETGRISESDCLPCLPSYCCYTQGNTQGTGDSLCNAGYYCDGEASNCTQHDCPKGSYCEEGSFVPKVCPSGTISTTTNNQNITDCSQCEPGKYCTEESSQTGVSNNCNAGFVCVGGAYVPDPVDNTTGYECPPGHRCPAGTSLEIACAPGTYQPQSRMDTCLICDAGFYCPYTNMTTPIVCPEGYYCLSGSTQNIGQCPAGTYSNQTGLPEESLCIDCPPGRYCDSLALTDPSTNFCTAGFLCVGNATTSTPNDGINKLCPVGHYCPEGTPSAIECPAGTLRSVTGALSENDCSPCPAARYCEQPGASVSTGDCLEGYYCPAAANISTPEPSEYQCPPGHRCPNATADPIPCTAGTYQPRNLSADCIQCIAGSYCLESTITPVICPVGSYCPAGSPGPILCPAGTYGNDTGLQAPDDCSPCVTGSYCTNGNITGLCSAGYYCISGNPTPTPEGSSPGVEGSPCPFGYYCLEGTTDPYLCPEGLVISNTGASTENNCTLCPAGYTCANSTIPLDCEAGQYCPGSVPMTPCPTGTFSNKTKATSSGECEACTPGYWCSFEGTVDPTLYPCPVGHYCPLGTGGAPNISSPLEPIPCAAGTYRSDVGATSLNDCYPCPAGYYCPNSTTVCYNCSDSIISGVACDPGMYCPAGSATYQWCAAGYYCNETKDKMLCPGGFYCPERSSDPIPCPNGSYCEAGSIRPNKCPLGYYEVDGSQRTTFADTCTACAAGYYGADEDRESCTICRAGVICKEAATTDNPEPQNATLNITNSYPCPPGYYCPSGATLPLPCPTGTYNPNEFAEDSTSSFCIPCPINYFNHLLGQTACQTCGGQASQPNTGQSSCLCSGSGRDFQPSDQNCPCASGYQISLERNGDCVRYIYDICPEGTSRTQNGSCYTDEQWAVYCTNEVCQTPDAFQGVDKVLGACKCLVDDLDSVCDSQCRARQPGLVEFCCPDPLVSDTPQIRILDSNGNFTYYSVNDINVINWANSISVSQCSTGTASCAALYITESAGNGFLGVYDPDSSQTNSLLSSNVKATAATSSRRRRSISDLSVYPGPRYEPPPVDYKFESARIGRTLLEDSVISVYSGILNPVTCVDYDTVMLFSVSNLNYPIYDQNNLYNTNENFDFGGFRDLENQMQLTGSNTTLFAYRFSFPGIYAFMLSSDNSKKFYVSVMDQGGTCTEQGPYFPQTPLYMIQNGLNLDSTILLAPDWIMISILLLTSIAVILILVGALILFRKYGWAKTSFLYAYYRAIGKAFNLDHYSSKGTTVHSLKKYHPNINAEDAGVTNPDVAEVVDDEFWDYERQIDVEQFSSQQFYNILTKQSHNVTSSVSKQKDEVKGLYQKISQQTQSLKDLWAAKLNLQGRASLATQEELADYERKKEEFDIEIERRRLLGEKFMSVLQQQRDIFSEDENQRKDHQVNFDATLKGVRQVLDRAVKSLQEGLGDSKDVQFQAAGRAGILINRLNELVSTECQRLGAWGVLGSGTGAKLLDPDTRKPLSLSDIIAPDGSIAVSESVCKHNPILGITVPANNTEMLLANGQTMVIPSGQYFVHPKTGRVLPIYGNICYDPVSSKVICGVDGSSAEFSKSEERPLPFIPYPVNSTGSLMNISLPHLERRADLRFGAPMIDPATGLTVPICGVTISPNTGTLHPVGGSFISPVTRLPTAMEIGSLMIDPDTEKPTPILAVAFDEEGKVIPLGGTMLSSTSTNIRTPILMGEQFKEPLSGKNVRVAGTRPLTVPGSHDMDVVPSAGGYTNILDARVLSCEKKVADTVKAYLDHITGQEATANDSFSNRPEISQLEHAMKDLTSARNARTSLMLRQCHDVIRSEERADILATSGGASGMMEYEATGQLLPILVGMDVKDPSGSDLQVPILGIDKAKFTGNIVPLAGSMEEPNGAGLIPIAIGSKAIDSASAKTGKVVGAKINTDTGIVIPMVQTGNLVHKRQRKVAPGSLAMLEEENAARKGFWRRQRQREIDLNRRLSTLTQDLSTNIDTTNSDKIEEHLEAISDSCYQLSGALKRETDRRQATKDELSVVLPPDALSILCENDSEEKLNEENTHADFNRLIESVRNFVRKLQLEDSRRDERLSEIAINHDTIGKATDRESIMMRHEQALKKIQSELLIHLENRMESSNVNLSILEYYRKISELLANEARDLLKESFIVGGDYEVATAGVYGDDVQMSSQSELVPILRQLIALLESGINFQLAPEMLTALQQTHSSQQQAKILETIRKTALQQQEQLALQKQSLGSGLSGTREQGTPAVLQINTERPIYGHSGENVASASDRRRKITVQEQVQLQAADKKVSFGDVASDPHDHSLIQKLKMRRMSSKLMLDSALEAQKSTNAETRDMMERHALEIAQLENELRSEEITKINEIISDIEQKKKDEITKLKIELKEKLKLCKTDEEKQLLMLEYAGKIQDVTESLEKEKQRRLTELRKYLADERQRRKKELYKKQVQEAADAGLDPNKVVTDITSEDEEEVNKDLLLLAQQQEKLIAELLKAYEEEDGENTEERKRRLDEEMEAKIRALNASRAASLIPQDEISDLLDAGKRDNERINSMRANMKEKMKMRRDRRKSKAVVLTAAEAEALNSQEAEIFNSGIEELEENKNERLEAAVLSAFEEVEWETSESLRAQKLEKLLSDGGNISEQERDELIEEYKRINKELKNRMDMQRKEQKQRLLAKLQARKKLKEDLSKERAVAKQLKLVTMASSTLPDGTDENTKEKIATTLEKIEEEHAASMIKQQRSHHVVLDTDLQQEQVEQLALLELKHLSEQSQMEDELDKEMEAEKLKIEKRMKEQAELQQAAAAARAKNESEEKNLNEKQTEKLIKQYQKQAEALNKSLSSEKNRQMNSLQERMKERRLKREKQLAAQQHADTEKEMIALKQVRSKEDNKQKSDIEKEAISELTGDKTIDASLEQFVQEILLPRHLKEMTELVQMLEREIEAAKNNAKAQAEADRDATREQVLQNKEKEINQLLLENAGEPTNKVMKLKQKLQAKHEQELKEFDRHTERYVQSAVTSVTAPLTVLHAQQKLELRAKHLQELADTLRSLNPQEMLIKQYAKEAARAAAEAENFRQAKAMEMQKKLDHMKEEKRRKESLANKHINDEITALERELSNESLIERENLEKQLQNDEQNVMSNEKKKQDEIMQASIDEDERERLLNEHQNHMKKLESQMEKNKARSRADLQRRLEERRHRRKAEKVGELQEELDKNLTKEQIEEAAKIEQLAQQNMENYRQTEDILRKKQGETLSVSGIGETQLVTDHNDGMAIPFAPGSSSVEDWSSLMLSSPFFEELKSVETTLKKHLSEQSQGVKSSVSTPFIDIQDAQWMLTENLSPVDVDKISSSEFVVYRFGVFVTNMMQKVLETGEVRLLLASQLPNNNYYRNAFRRSIHFQRAPSAMLFIRRERLTSVGDLIMVIVHSMAHISVGQMEDDSDPYFLRAFYKGMKSTCEDLFFARARAAKRATNIYQASHTDSDSMDLNPLRSAKTLEEKTSVLEDLVETKVFLPAEEKFTRHSIQEKMSNYNDLNNKQKIQKVLSACMKKVEPETNVAQRLRKLRGHDEEPKLSVSFAPLTASNSTNAKDAIKDQAEQLKDESDKVDNRFAETSSQLLRLVEGMEDDNSSFEVQPTEEQHERMHKLRLKQTNVINKAQRLDIAIEDKLKMV